MDKNQAWEVSRGVLVVVVSTAIVSAAVSLYNLASGPFLSGVPAGAIMAIDGSECPTGWTAFESGRDRFIVGAGTTHAYRQLGGSETALIQERHSPPHRHEIETFDWGHSVKGDRASERIDVDDGPPYNGITGTLVTTSFGLGEPLRVMPPFIALPFCIKN